MGNKGLNSTSESEFPRSFGTQSYSSRKGTSDKDLATYLSQESMLFAGTLLNDRMIQLKSKFSQTEYRLIKHDFIEYCKFQYHISQKHERNTSHVSFASKIDTSDLLGMTGTSSPSSGLASIGVIPSKEPVLNKKQTFEMFRRSNYLNNVDEEQIILESIWRAINLDSDFCMSFPEFIDALGICLRGDLEDRISFSYRIYRSDEAECISRRQVEVLLDALEDLKIYPVDVAKYTSADEKNESSTLKQFIMKTFFANGSKEELLFDEYRSISLLCPIMAQGLGIYEHIFNPIWIPIRDFLKDNSRRIASFVKTKKGKNLCWGEVEAGTIKFYPNQINRQAFEKKTIDLTTIKEVVELPAYPTAFLLSFNNISKKKLIFTPDEETKKRWVYTIKVQIVDVSENRYTAYFPLRKTCRATWYVDGKEYFAQVAKDMCQAKETIFITDWCMSPSIYLIRDVPNAHEYRLDMILQRKAMEGVKIFIILWREVTLAKMNLEALETTKYLEALHSNIRVCMHPQGSVKNKLFKWTHHQKTVVIDQKIAYLGGLDFAFGRFDDSSHSITDANHCNMKFPGADYYNPNYRGFIPIPEPINAFSDGLDRFSVPRMPWHDVHCRVVGNDIVSDVASNFIMRWNHHNKKLSKKLYKSSLSASGNGITAEETDTLSTTSSIGTNSQDETEFVGQHEDITLDLKSRTTSLDIDNEFNDSSFGPLCSAQILRSMDEWSGTVDGSKECSILNAMLDLIAKSQHYIYIEQQFFISGCGGSVIQNTVGDALLERLRQAIIRKQNFKVFVIIPIHSEGNILGSNSMHQILKHQFNTICRGEQSILNKLHKEFPLLNINNYISFYSLRNYDFLNYRAVTEIIYVHSKLMIVDDKYTLIGSANLNDRSLLGSGDSEIAVLIEDSEFELGRLNGGFENVGKFAKSLRMRLWKEHFGIPLRNEGPTTDHLANLQERLLHNSMEDIKKNISTTMETFVNIPLVVALEDPCNGYSKWLERAKRNTEIFNTVFKGIIEQDHLYPTLDIFEKAINKYQIDFERLSLKERIEKLEKDKKMLQNIQGHLVEYPLHFLDAETWDKTLKMKVLEEAVFI